MQTVRTGSISTKELPIIEITKGAFRREPFSHLVPFDGEREPL